MLPIKVTNKTVIKTAQNCMLLAAVLLSDYSLAKGDGFTGGVTPSRFELQSTSGKLVRRSLAIYNLGIAPAKYRVRTVDWSYSERGEISFIDTLTKDSCRRWVRLEQHQVSVLPDPKRPRNFRFEINIPEDAPRQECRFALMLEGIDDEFVTQLSGGQIAMPITGRIAVIVYLGINGVAPNLTVSEIITEKHNGKTQPLLKVTNSGDGHGRLDSELTAKTRDGDKLKLVVASSPVLPGQTRYLTLSPIDYKKPIKYPLTIKGRIFSDNHTYSVETRVLGE